MVTFAIIEIGFFFRGVIIVSNLEMWRKQVTVSYDRYLCRNSPGRKVEEINSFVTCFVSNSEGKRDYMCILRSPIKSKNKSAQLEHINIRTISCTT